MARQECFLNLHVQASNRAKFTSPAHIIYKPRPYNLHSQFTVMADVGWTIGVKWSGQKIDISGVQAGTTVSELKQAIQAHTGVLPEGQKLLGVRFPHKTDIDALTLSELGMKNGGKIMMMGSREETIAAAQEVPADSSDVVDDCYIKFNDIPIESRQEFLAKVDRRVKDYPIKILNEPRPGKKLLVLDVDGTLFDNWSVGEKGSDLMRPFLHGFLTEVYLYTNTTT